MGSVAARGLCWTVVVLIALACGTPGARAARSRSFRTETYEGFLRFEAEGVTVEKDGRVTLAPKTDLLADPGVRTVWALADDGKGRIAMSTGDQGQLAIQSIRGSLNKPETLAELFDYELFALASNDKGDLYVSGAPNGTVVRVTPDGQTHTMFDVPEGVVFSLLSAPDGSVYAATGERGRLYHISAGGEAKVSGEAPDQTLRCITWGAGGKIWAGTDGRGLLLEITPSDGRTRVLYDAPEQEVAAIVPLPQGGAVFGANPGQAGGGGGGDASAPSGGDDQSDSDSSGGTGAKPARGGAQGAGGGDTGETGARPAVYQLLPNGSVRLLWRCPQRILHALALDAEGNILVATGDQAAIYRISLNGDEAVIWQPKEEQALSMLVDGRTLYAGTGNPGRLYRLGPEISPEGTLTSNVLDARDQSTWGILRWEGTGPGDVSFETRSGFTDAVDSTWSDWAPLQQKAEGSFVASPPARFLQWRAHLKASGKEGPVLRRVVISYGGANRAPRMLSLRISPDEPLFTTGDQGRAGSITQMLPGGIQIDYSLPPASPVVSADDVPLWVRRIRSIVWEAQDPDGDDLAYTVEIRQEGEQKYRVLAKDVRDRGYSVESSTVPDGVYEVRVTVSDGPSNPPGTELTDSQVTIPFHIDTIAPVVQDLKSTRPEPRVIEVSGVAVDESSPLHRIEVSIDGGPFRWLTPTDGLMDSPREAFHGRVALDPDQDGSWIAVRAQDEAGNRGSYRAWLEK